MKKQHMSSNIYTIIGNDVIKSDYQEHTIIIMMQGMFTDNIWKNFSFISFKEKKIQSYAVL